MKVDHQQSFLQRLCQDLPAVSNYMIKGSTWSTFIFEFAFCETGFRLFDIYFQKGGVVWAFTLHTPEIF